MANKARLSKSGVSWTNYSWGVVDGCTKTSEACAHCYAEPMITRFQPGRKFSEVRTHPERLEAPLNTKKPGKVFVAPLGDLFHPDVPFEFIDQVFAMIALCPQHTFQILTKRPDIMLKYYSDEWRESLIEGNMQRKLSEMHGRKDWIVEESFHFNDLENLWVGATIENQQRADERIPILLQIPAAVRFVSIEPMLGPVKLKHYLSYDGTNGDTHCDWCGGFRLHRHDCYDAGPGIQLVICGGESGPHARPSHPENVRNLRDECVEHGVAFFFKQWGEYVPDLMYDGCRTYTFPDGTLVFRVGTKKAGNLLDGQTWQQMPEVNHG